ncbi:MAG: ketopantoate reductase family protein [Clostridia bacterium]|nr:ketopantoate reductase family protein [Clostridia bacterium]
MKVLVYGAGVIGCYLAHALCAAGNDVTVLARGRWKEQLEQNGLRIRHHLQRRETLDRPRVIGDISEDDTYDAAFAVMPYHKIGAILEPLARLNTPVVVLVGNNMRPAAMRETILRSTVCPKAVLFGFQVTAGRRDVGNGLLICERAGAGTMDIGGLHDMPDEALRAKLEAAFGGTGYKLRWQADMEAYLVCHLAAILPIGYLTYACGGDMTPSTGAQRRLMWLASGEAYALLRDQGVPMPPDGDDRYYRPGVLGLVMRFLYFVMAKNRTIGDLVACVHCRNAWQEMRMLDEAFDAVIARTPDAPMARWRALKAQMPDWDEVARIYGSRSEGGKQG